ncbi:long-chain fatty acid--CoA ligase [Desulfitobacterium sp.]|uniref:long-chain-fatty-acid--CoA ligase n=1 Tax=Desulfitobacterium sp. TaxID=49981 RepID=UPI002CA7170E|nr:long-chain fatty acid--CoA ligase [Desulfitobacterium sp.]HVJ49963.1 long-chain fatty acid--CoA ligase [Desulfitobacterium sp.]
MREKPWLSSYEPGVRATLEIPNITLLEMFKQTVERFSEHPALLFQGRSWSYRQMDEAVERMARALSYRGVKSGDRISIYMPNSALWVISFYACMRLGAVVVQTNPMYVESELKAQLNDAGAIGIITIPPLLQRVLAIQGETNLQLIAVDPLANLEIPISEKLLNLDALLNDSSLDRMDLPLPNIPADTEIAVLQYTGGTTGTSKGVVLTHRNLLANALQIKEWLQGEEGQERILTALPLFHIYSLSACMNLAMVSGGAMVILSKFDIDVVLQHINDYAPTIFPGAPTMYVAIINHPRVKEYNVSSIKVCVSGSAPLPVEVANRFGELTGGRLIEAYGLSEASPATHLNPVDHARVGSIGVPGPNTDAKIVDLATGQKTLVPGEIGELAVSGDQVMREYWQKPTETLAVLRDGWLYTGDIARMDEDGFFYIVDRKKDMIISGGYNVYPRDIEESLYEHSAVKEAVCAGIPDSYWGEFVKAYVVLKEDAQVTEAELLTFLKQKLAAYKVPKKIEIRESLPRTAVGKVLRRFLIDEELQKTTHSDIAANQE